MAVPGPIDRFSDGCSVDDGFPPGLGGQGGDAVAAAYDAIAAEYDAQVAGDAWMRRVLWGRYAALFRPGQHILDVGCGSGADAIFLARRGVRVTGIDVSPAMTGYLRSRATDLGLDNVEPITATAIDLPLPDRSASVIVSNYVYHHLNDADKQQGLAEAFRVLQPGGRIVIGDMMFRPELGDRRNRRVIISKVKSFLSKGPAGVWRLLKNLLRYAAGQWEQPADPEWWRHALEQAGFIDVELQPLEHEGGIVSGRRPA